ncbi:autotransporter outer membrane beta-barrel domain-containing protein [Sphingomonas soli]|uniref:autotransporter outer membrane beta-barrel domain-containing protein n=1 Tax=Sphingomonas soli TaxID=266127 RepID=UPI00082D923F|nr:autotransporter outer membrane beta-barrel domain-containing protein [Sphingomonas soli]
MKLVRNSRAARVALLASAATLSLGFAASASAQTTGKISASEAERESQGSGARIDAGQVVLESQGSTIDYSHVLIEPQAHIDINAQPDPEILIANPGTATTARDPVNVTGIGQVISDEGGGFIGLCTGTLINPRTVIFAAHCVNDTAATDYGVGGKMIGIGFETNTRANAAGQTDELVRWLLGGTGGAGKGQTNIAQAFYNINQIKYNPYSLEPAANGFLYGDVALATLDTPAANVPTWALLFSPLTNTGTIGAAGTGFNVGIVGYGNNGTGTGGASTSTDFRRRAAENVLGALTDLQTFEGFLFGGAPNGLTQNLYFLDFDDPRRGTAQASPFDFNAFRDNARPGANGGASLEGITSQGDSGGPLILQNFTQQFVIGVLSGGYTRFFNGQPANGYGTVSFYQPLYLYWDYIAANNPYHYVSSVAGNANWTDATHWITTLDPAYYVMGVNATPVNGIPTNPGEQKNGTSGDFGQICFQSGGTSDCLDTRTGNEVVEARPIGTAESQPASGDIASAASQPALARVDGSEAVLESQAGGITTQALPPATLANGLPGATNFVPINVDPVRTTGAAGRYFDVSLIANGTTTLNTATTIDRLTFGGNGATLAVTSAGTLNSLININHFAGTLDVNGTVNSVGDYSFFGGLISGSGRINAPFVTSVLGQFAPGTMGTTGTLTIGGNLILSSGSTYFVDLSSTASDVIAVRATTFNGTTPTNGQASLGGNLAITYTNALRAGQSYTILTAEGGITGTFVTPTAVSGILRPTVTYTANAVRLAITAGTYASVIDTTSPTQVAFGKLLDLNRPNAATLDGIYGPLDLASAAAIRTTLEGLAPTTETTVRGLGTAMVDSSASLIRDRVETLDLSSAGGTVAHIGQPLRVASTSINSMSNLAAPVLIGGGDEQTTVQEGALPENMSAFIAGGYVEGNSRAMPALIATARDKFDGWYVAGGLETLIGDNGAIGFALSYSDMDSAGAVAGHSAKATLIQGSLYSKYESSKGLVLDAQISAGALDTDTRRVVNFVGTNYTLSAKDTALAFSSEAGIGYKLGTGGIAITPRAAVRSTYIDFSRTIETGGPVAMRYNRQPVSSSQLRGGVTLAGNGSKVKPFVTGTYVYDFGKTPTAFSANFVGVNGTGTLFNLAKPDTDWGEISGGLTINTGSVNVSIAGETTVGRDDVEVRSIRGSIGFRF